MSRWLWVAAAQFAVCWTCINCTPSPLAAPSGAPESASPQTPDASPDAIDTRSWASAADSTFEEGANPHVPGSCLVDRGCAHKGVRLPPCNTKLNALRVEELHARATTLDGKQVLVRGHLGSGGAVTTLGCGWECCNRSKGPLVLYAWANPPEAQRPAIRLVAAGLPNAFRCRGDESRGCCGFELGEVVIRGRLAVQATDTRVYLALHEPHLCDPTAELETQVQCEGRSDASEAFPMGAAVCGCAKGRAYCQTDSRRSCFLGGVWFGDGTTLPRLNLCQNWRCRQGTWEVNARDCGQPISRKIDDRWEALTLTFPRLSTKLSPQAGKVLDEVVSYLKEQTTRRAEVRVHFDYREQADKEKMARARAKVLEGALRERSAPAARVTVKVLPSDRRRVYFLEYPIVPSRPPTDAPMSK